VAPGPGTMVSKRTTFLFALVTCHQLLAGAFVFCSQKYQSDGTCLGCGRNLGAQAPRLSILERSVEWLH